mgnify:CR=1 FL=1|tara:strand:+ start:168 stop:461 length:294 start_codon:yes stop_codon:yes gene_type:complete
MANIVNPPPFLKLPDAFFNDRQIRAFVQQQNQIIFQLWTKLGGSTDPISDLQNFSSNGFSSNVQWLQSQADGLPEFTIDTSGFTIDTSHITTDKATA